MLTSLLLATPAWEYDQFAEQHRLFQDLVAYVGENPRYRLEHAPKLCGRKYTYETIGRHVHTEVPESEESSESESEYEEDGSDEESVDVCRRYCCRGCFRNHEHD